MRRRWPWVVLLLLLAAIIVVWLIPKPARVREVGESASAANAPAPVTPRNEPALAPTMPAPTETEPPKPAAPNEPAPLKPWKPLPPPPKQNLRAATEADTWFGPKGDEAEKLAAIATRRFGVTIKGKVATYGIDTSTTRIRVWADSLGWDLSRGGPNEEPPDPELERDGLWRYWPAANPQGETTALPDGTFTLDLQVTGADRKQIIQAHGGGGQLTGSGEFVARIQVKAQGGDCVCMPAKIYPLKPDQVFEKAYVALASGPFWDCRVFYDDNTPAADVMLFVDTLTKSDEKSREYAQEQRSTDAAGNLRVRLHEGLGTTVMAWNGAAQGMKLIFTKEEMANPPTQIVLPRKFKSIRKVVARITDEDGADVATGIVCLIEGDDQPLLVESAKEGGWRRFQYDPKDDARYTVFSRKFGSREFTLQRVVPGMVLELDELALPGPRTSRIIVIGPDGKPAAGARITGRTEDAPELGDYVRAKLAETRTSEFGIADIEVLPGREYRVSITLTDGGPTQHVDFRFTHAGPREIKWKAE